MAENSWEYDIVDKTHAQHFVGFVQHQRLQAVELEFAAAHVVHDTPWRTHHHVDAASQLAQLHLVGLAAVNRHDVEVLQVARVGLEGFRYLYGQFARGCQHQDLHIAPPEIQAREQGQRESGGLAGAGLRLTEQVVSFEQRRNGLGLDR